MSASEGRDSSQKSSKFAATTPRPTATIFLPFLQCTSDGEVYLDLSFIALRLPFTSFFTNVIGIGLAIGKLTMAFVVG